MAGAAGGVRVDEIRALLPRVQCKQPEMQRVVRKLDAHSADSGRAVSRNGSRTGRRELRQRRERHREGGATAGGGSVPSGGAAASGTGGGSAVGICSRPEV